MRATVLTALVAAMVLVAAPVSEAGRPAGTAASTPSDTIDDDIARLEGARDYKLRISAALRLAKSHDPRAIAALVDVLEDPDGRRTLRRIAALSLGAMVVASTPTRLRRRVASALTTAADRDSDRKVRRNAKRSLDALANAPTQTARDPRGGEERPPQRRPRTRKRGVFLHVGAPRDMNRRKTPGLSARLRETVREAVQAEAPGYQLDWSSGELPTTSELEQAGLRAYHVRTTVQAYEIHRKGTQVEVQCTVSIQVNPWHGSDSEERWAAREAASASGRGRATGNDDQRSIDGAKRDCAAAVAGRITTEQVVPFVERLDKQRR